LVDVTLTLAEDNNTKALTRNYSSVPVQRNYRTNIIGNILTSPAEFNVVILPGFEEETLPSDYDDILNMAAQTSGVYELTEDVVLTPYSGYCGYQRQKNIYDNKVQAFVLQGLTEDEAKLSAEKRVEPAGCSENGAGLAVDVISASAGFSSTNEYKWLVANAHNYGFVLRYPEDKTEITGMIYQPWHWRYVGIEVATEMKEQNLCLEEFLGAV
jgi:D-alanyl-D-alanine carboxypeptidase